MKNERISHEAVVKGIKTLCGRRVLKAYNLMYGIKQPCGNLAVEAYNKMYDEIHAKKEK